MAERIVWGSFPLLRDFDRFTIDESGGMPNQVKFILKTGAIVTWWKALKILRRDGSLVNEVTLQDSNHGPTMELIINQADYSNMKLVFAKAKIFGIHTDMYELFEFEEMNGRTLTLTWETDGPDNVWAAIGGFFSDVATGFVKGVVTVVNTIITVVETLVGWFVDAGAWFVGLFLSIPILGTFLRQLWNLITFAVLWVVNFFVEVTFAVLGVIGVRTPEKKLPLMIINQIDPATGTTVATNDQIKKQLDFLIRLYQVRANIKVVPLKPWNFTTPFNQSPFNLDDFIVTQTSVNPATLTVNCETEGYANDWGLAGASFTFMINNLYWGGGRRLIGIGKGIVVFAVKNFAVPSNTAGCSLGPLTDYVLVDFEILDSSMPPVNISQYSVLAHEVGHSLALGLPHSEDMNNLMFKVSPSPTPEGNFNNWLSNTDVFIMRNSNRLSYS